MKQILKLAGALIVFIAGLQLVLHWWMAQPAPRYAVLSKRQFEVIAHRGGRESAPPGTLQAMSAALAAGTDVLEMDIHMSRDGYLVVFHDQRMDRTTDCSGEISGKTLAEIQSCDKGYRFQRQKADRPQDPALEGDASAETFRNRGYRIPTLESVFQSFPGQRMIIEIKQREPSLVPVFCRLIRTHVMQDRLIVGSFRQEALNEFRATCPEVATSASPKEATTFIMAGKTGLSSLISPVYAALQVPPRMRLPGILPTIEVATPALVKRAHKKGLAVQVWTVNDPREMRQLLAAGVDGIMTDVPSLLVGIAKRR